MKGSGSGPARRFGRVPVLLTGLLLGASVLQTIPLVAGPALADVTVLPPENPPPPLTDAQRQQVPAAIQPVGVLDPQVAPALTGASPTDFVSGLTEDLSLRTASAQVYQVNGADHVLRVSAAPLNYADPGTGTYLPIVDTLVPDVGAFLKNAANAFTVHFPQTIGELNPISVSVPGGSYTFTLANGLRSTTTAAAGASTLTYPGVLPFIDLTYWLVPEGLREAIVMNSQAAENEPLAFTIRATGLSLRRETDTGEISVLDSAGTVVGTIPGAPGGGLLGGPRRGGRHHPRHVDPHQGHGEPVHPVGVHRPPVPGQRAVPRVDRPGELHHQRAQGHLGRPVQPRQRLHDQRGAEGRAVHLDRQPPELPQVRRGRLRQVQPGGAVRRHVPVAGGGEQLHGQGGRQARHLHLAQPAHLERPALGQLHGLRPGLGARRRHRLVRLRPAVAVPEHPGHLGGVDQLRGPPGGPRDRHLELPPVRLPGDHDLRGPARAHSGHRPAPGRPGAVLPGHRGHREHPLADACHHRAAI